MIDADSKANIRRAINAIAEKLDMSEAAISRAIDLCDPTVTAELMAALVNKGQVGPVPE